MKQRITYHDDGSRTFEIEGKVVSEDDFKEATLRVEGARLKEMLDSQSAPHGVSDCTFMRDTANGKQFAGQEHVGNAYRKTAESAGVSTVGKKYISGLAAYPGDPKAWVDSRGDVQRVLEERGWGSEGTVNVKPKTDVAPVDRPDVDEKLVKKYATEIAMRDPNPHLVDMKDLKDQVREKITPPKHLRRKKS